jgi:hypothetical protein
MKKQKIIVVDYDTCVKETNKQIEDGWSVVSMAPESVSVTSAHSYFLNKGRLAILLEKVGEEKV